MTTCCTSSGATPARSNAALIAVAPNSVGSTVERPPPSLPTGVRAAPRITVLGMRRETRHVQATVPATSGQVDPNLGPPPVRLWLVPALTDERKREQGQK